jgi:hypothetical protein
LLNLSFVLGACAASSSALAQSPSPVAANRANDVLTNENVLALVAAGLSDETIVLKIRGSQARFDTAADALVRLKQAGVSDAVLAQMLDPMRGGDSLAVSVRTLEPGVYLSDEGQPLVLIAPSMFSAARNTVSWKTNSYKLKTQVTGSRASVRTNRTRPAFEFHFASTGGLEFPVPGAASPAEFFLVKLDPKKNRRELTVGETRWRSHTGVTEKQMLPVDIERLGPGHYRVAPTLELEPGEYCFIHQTPTTASAAGAGGKLFAFGLDGPSTRTAR